MEEIAPQQDAAATFNSIIIYGVIALLMILI
jgi:hypothetical protein